MTSMTDPDPGFGGIARLFSKPALGRLRQAHVAVVGIGGVGSWALEALARSGVGALTLIDLDDICVSNLNRQVHALAGTVGRSKVEVMAERIQSINPACQVRAIPEFFTEANADRLLGADLSGVIDAIDNAGNKCLLIARCRERRLRLICSGGAGGRRDPTAVRSADLADASNDRLLAQVRRQLRREWGFPKAGERWGVPCVFSLEPPVYPGLDGSICHQKPKDPTGADLRLNCDAGLGTASFVTGAFGFAAAGLLVRELAGAD